MVVRSGVGCAGRATAHPRHQLLPALRAELIARRDGVLAGRAEPRARRGARADAALRHRQRHGARGLYGGQTQFQIDPARCTECVGSYASSRCAEVCPVDAPKPDDAHKETREALLAKWKTLHPGETPKV